MSLGSKTGKVKCSSHHTASRVHSTNMTYQTGDVDHDYLAEMALVRLLPYMFSSLSFHALSFGRKSLCAGHS